MSEPLFEFAFSDMLWKAMRSDPRLVEAMKLNYDLMMPQLPMREDAAAIQENAGLGGTSMGFHIAGIPTAVGIDAQPEVNIVRRPHEERTMEVWLGTEQGQAHPDDQVEIYADALAGRKGHQGASPPCQMLSSASTGGLTAQERMERALEGIPPVRNALYTIQQMQKHPDVDLNSWHLEQAKEVIPVLLRYPELLFQGDTALDRDFGKRVLAMLRGKGEMGTLRQNPRMNAIDYGAPSTRNRLVIGEGWAKKPTHYDQTRSKPVVGRLPSRSFLDVMPHFQTEWEQNKDRGDEWIQALTEHGRLTEAAGLELGAGPQVSLSGATVPGKGNTGPIIHPLGIRGGGSVWDDARGPRNKQRRSFSHSYPMTRHSSGMTHNRPQFMFQRPFTDEEFLMAQMFDPTYNIDAIRDLNLKTYTTGKSQGVVDTGLGNAMLPPVSYSIAADAYNQPLNLPLRMGNAQRSLLDYP